MLYEIISPNGSKSYLFGTMHVNDEEVITLPLEVKVAFDSSNCCVFEVDTSLVDQEKIKQAIKTWSAKQPPLTLNATGDLEIISGECKPLIPEALALSIGSHSSRLINPLDLQLISAAKKKDKRVLYLEDWEKQIHLLYGLQFDFVFHYKFYNYITNNLHRTQTLFNLSKEAYLKQDMKFFKAHPQEDRHTPSVVHQYHKELSYDRDPTLAESIKKCLEQELGIIFIAVGIAHLCGIIEILKLAGYTINSIPLGQRLYPIAGSIEDGKKVEAFRRIYHALYSGQSNALKTKGLFYEPEMILSYDHIVDYVMKYPNTRAAEAWRLANIHLDDVSAQNVTLVKDIHKYALNNSSFSFFKKFISNTPGEHSIQNASENSRTERIVTALNEFH
ncbi:TraB family [Legionella steigerwaltii]|uniref:TraB family n=1 Tax=Legionella steigerwaltii TaxID=460 RepID=A0A378LB08_9GAMM|nr:TraB/GumN family protein [Legionella steigerwaltii]KTD70279.1 TraB family protein [Legionella steigerwaltii]STY24013.1 TraB family [Legionella steigerwaltii]